MVSSNGTVAISDIPTERRAFIGMTVSLPNSGAISVDLQVSEPLDRRSDFEG